MGLPDLRLHTARSGPGSSSDEGWREGQQAPGPRVLTRAGLQVTLLLLLHVLGLA